MGVDSPAFRANSTAFGKARSTCSGSMCAPARTVHAIALKPASAATAAPSYMSVHCTWRDTRQSCGCSFELDCILRGDTGSVPTIGEIPSIFSISRRECLRATMTSGHDDIIVWSSIQQVSTR